mmetsp:Transcript_124119/g.397241  ORF Transcript_124119/g.397241 Transcript_124119/m.397241 type:complete len:294 (+) Transcript_124119:118-999(+)
MPIVRLHVPYHADRLGKGFQERSEERKHHVVEEANLGLRDPRLVAIHQEGDAVEAELLLPVALLEELRLQAVHPAQVLVPAQGQVAQVRTLDRKLQHDVRVPRRSRSHGAVTLGLGEALEVLEQPAVLRHVRGQDQVHDEAPEVEGLLRAQALHEVQLRLQQQPPSRRHVVLLIRAAVVVGDGPLGLRLDQEVVRDAQVLKVVHRGGQHRREHDEATPSGRLLHHLHQANFHGIQQAAVCEQHVREVQHGGTVGPIVVLVRVRVACLDSQEILLQLVRIQPEHLHQAMPVDQV